MEKKQRLVIIVKIEKYIEYMLTIDEKKYKHSNELLAEIGKILGGLIKSLEVKKYA